MSRGGLCYLPNSPMLTTPFGAIEPTGSYENWITFTSHPRVSPSPCLFFRVHPRPFLRPLDNDNLLSRIHSALSGSSSVVEHRLAKARVASSSLVSRSSSLKDEG